MPEFRILMDPFNPGQYYACCGLLEIVSRETPARGAVRHGRGVAVGEEFLLRTDGMFDLHQALWPSIREVELC